MTIVTKFDQWLETYGKKYTSTEEYWTRIRVFYDNMKTIDMVNDQGLSFSLALN
jgi:hypothetical protein